MTSQESISLFVLPSSQCLNSKCSLILFHSYKAQKAVTGWLQKLVVKVRCCPLLVFFFRQREEKQKIKSWCLKKEMTKDFDVPVFSPSDLCFH